VPRRAVDFDLVDTGAIVNLAADPRPLEFHPCGRISRHRSEGQNRAVHPVL
jgi:hypothetical protein